MNNQKYEMGIFIFAASCKNTSDGGDQRPPTLKNDGGGDRSGSNTPTPGLPTGGDAPASNEALEALLLHQLYGMGYGAGVPAAALAAASYNQSNAIGAGESPIYNSRSAYFNW